MDPFRQGLLLIAASCCFFAPAASQPQGPATTPPDSSIETTVEAGEAEVAEPRRKLVNWNEYEGPFFTIRVGAGFLYDYAAYDQDEESKQQFALEPGDKVRDFRFLLKG